MSCQRGYEVSLTVPGLKVTRSVVFTQRAVAKKFQGKHQGARLAVVSICDGVIKKRGKRVF